MGSTTTKPISFPVFQDSLLSQIQIRIHEYLGPGPLFWRPWWIAENGTGNAALYNGAGVEKAVSVTIRRPIRPTRHPDRFDDRARISNDNQTDFLLVGRGDRQGPHIELAHIQEMERLACSAGASLRPPAKR